MLQLHNEIVRVRRARRLLNLRVRRIEASVADVLANRRRKEHRLLRYKPNLPAQRRERYIADVMPVNADRAAVHLVKPRNEVCDRRFARARRTDKGDHFSRGGIERHAAERRVPLLVRKRNVLEADMPLHGRQGLRPRLIRDRLFEIHNGKDAIHRSHCLLEIAVDAREPLHRICKVHGIGEEGDERPRRNVAVDNLIAAEPHDERHGDRREKLYRRRQHTRLLNILHYGVKIAVVAGHEAVDFIILAHERLDHARCGKALLQERRDFGEPCLNNAA